MIVVNPDNPVTATVGENTLAGRSLADQVEHRQAHGQHARADRRLRDRIEAVSDRLDQVSSLILLVADVQRLMDVAGPMPEENERLGAILWLRQHAQARGDEATLHAQLEIDPKNAAILYDLGCARAAAGKYEEALALLYDAAQKDPKLGKTSVRETMVKIFHAVGVRSPLADDYRQKLQALLY